jgi:hypothetical protein
MTTLIQIPDQEAARSAGSETVLGCDTRLEDAVDAIPARLA